MQSILSLCKKRTTGNNPLPFCLQRSSDAPCAAGLRLKEKDIKDYGGIIINSEGRTVEVDSKKIDLSLREYELLKYLVDNEGIALSRDKILNNVWNYDYYGDSRTIDSHIKKIRHKLGKKGKYIHTMRGVGYKFEIEEK